MNTPRRWHSRGYLPHFDGGETTQFVTFRLADSLPTALLKKWKEEIKHLEDIQRKAELRKRVELFLDTGYGKCHLKAENIASIVRDKILEFHQTEYKLIARVIMPNHAHLLFKLLPDKSLEMILKNIKGTTARKANQLLGRTGRFWQKEYFDRYIRDSKHFYAVFNYIENNPVKARLCRSKEDCKFSSAFKPGSA